VIHFNSDYGVLLGGDTGTNTQSQQEQSIPQGAYIGAGVSAAVIITISILVIVLYRRHAKKQEEFDLNSNIALSKHNSEATFSSTQLPLE
jgi:hypothetical protein